MEYPNTLMSERIREIFIRRVDRELSDFVAPFLGEMVYGQLDVYRKPYSMSYGPAEWYFTYFDFASHLCMDGIACSEKGNWHRYLPLKEDRRRKGNTGWPAHRLAQLKRRLRAIPEQRDTIIKKHGLHILTELNGNSPEKYHTSEELVLMHEVGYPYEIPEGNVRPLLTIRRKGRPKSMWEELGLL